jgi:hypothetical protein
MVFSEELTTPSFKSKISAASRALCLLLGLLFGPEDGGSILHRNVGELLRDYTASHPRMWFNFYCFLRRRYFVCFETDGRREYLAYTAVTRQWLRDRRMYNYRF